MHVFIYQFQVKPGKEADFVEAWKQVTEGIKKYRGGLGSRLHRDAEGNFIAYAQWPSRAVAEAKVSTPGPHQEWVSKMKDALVKTEVLHELEVVEDLLE